MGKLLNQTAILCAIIAAVCWGCAGDNGKTTPAQKTPAQQAAFTTCVVSNAKEFVAAIAPNRVIQLKPGDYSMSELPAEHTKYVTWVPVNDGNEIQINNVSNLTISCPTPGQAKMIIKPRYAYVLSFVNCKNLSISGLGAGHGPEKGFCTGGVLAFENSSNVLISDCTLYGCGTEGLTLKNVENFSFQKSTIRDCTCGIMSVFNSKKIQFKNSKFSKNREFDMVTISSSSEILFDGCEFSDNETGDDMVANYSLFFVRASSNILVKKCRIANNKTQYLMYYKGSVAMLETVEEGNKFSLGRYQE